MLGDDLVKSPYFPSPFAAFTTSSFIGKKYVVFLGVQECLWESRVTLFKSVFTSSSVPSLYSKLLLTLFPASAVTHLFSTFLEISSSSVLNSGFQMRFVYSRLIEKSVEPTQICAMPHSKVFFFFKKAQKHRIFNRR